MAMCKHYELLFGLEPPSSGMYLRFQLLVDEAMDFVSDEHAMQRARSDAIRNP